MSLSGVQWHFKNKEELIQGLMEYLRVLPVIVAEVGLARGSDAPDLATQLAHVAQAVTQQLPRHGGLLRHALADADRYPEVARFAMQHTIGRALPLLAQVFEEHARRGTVTPGSSLVRAQAFMGMMVSRILLDPLIGGLLPDLETCSREYVALMTRGVEREAAA
jgi:AcrR family transcriptional regulator